MPKSSEKKESAWFKYVCDHGASNEPCPEHHPNEKKVKANWQEDYETPTPEQLADGQ